MDQAQFVLGALRSRMESLAWGAFEEGCGGVGLAWGASSDSGCGGIGADADAEELLLELAWFWFKLVLRALELALYWSILNRNRFGNQLE